MPRSTSPPTAPLALADGTATRFNDVASLDPFGSSLIERDFRPWFEELKRLVRTQIN